MTTTTAYYMSLDQTMCPVEILLSPSRTVALLAAGASSSSSVSVTVPRSVPVGSYYPSDSAPMGAESPRATNPTVSRFRQLYRVDVIDARVSRVDSSAGA